MAADLAVKEETGTKREREEVKTEGAPDAKAAKVDAGVKAEKKDKDEKKDKKEKKEKDKKEKKSKDGKEKADSQEKEDEENQNTSLDQRKMFKEGQKNITPPIADATRGFYESLLAENPGSKIAIKFAVEYGLKPKEEHMKLLKKYNALKESGAYNTGTALKKAIEQKEAAKSQKKAGKENKENVGEKKEKKDGKDGKEKKEKKEGKEGKEKKDKKEKKA